MVIGFTEGSIPEIAVNRLLLRNVSVVGAGWGAFAIPRPDYAREVAADLDRMVAEGHVKPIIGKTYAFDDVPQALRDIDERRATGKLVLEVRLDEPLRGPRRSSPARSRARSPTATSARRSRTRPRSTRPRRGGSWTRAAR